MLVIANESTVIYAAKKTLGLNVCFFHKLKYYLSMIAGVQLTFLFLCALFCP